MTVKTDNDLIDYVSGLARLTLGNDERTSMAAELGAIIEYAGALSSIDTDGVEPLSHVFAVTNSLREDSVWNGLDNLGRDALLANAPSKKDGTFVVPKTVE